MTGDVLAAREVRTDAGVMRVLVGGDGPAVLYLHGVGDTGTVNPLLPRLASDHLVIRPDHPGFLGSDPLGCASVADLAVRHVALLDVLEVASCTVIGSSFGGWVAAELALAAPDRVDELILVDPAGLRGPEPAVDLFGLSPEGVIARSFHDPRLKNVELAPEARAALRGNLEVARQFGPTLADPSLAPRLRAHTAPTTIVWGSEDEIFPLSYLDEWQAAVPHARTRTIPAAGHVPHSECTDAFLASTRWR